MRYTGAIVVLLWLTGLTPAADDGGVKKAVERGVAFLKADQQADGTWPHAEIGATALAGLTLLECNVPADDPAVVKAAEAVRKAGITLTHTYSLSLSIMFLDRLGDPGDVPLIESMAVRLMAGQNSVGGWTYQCPSISDEEARRLTTVLKQKSELRAKGELPKAREAMRTVKDLAPEIQQQLRLINNQAANPKAGKKEDRDHGDDNSNTQFATLALWVARRHGMPTEKVLGNLDSRFRKSQNDDGGWGYKFQQASPGDRRNPGKRTNSTATMTCAGLLGLAVAHGAHGEAALRTDSDAKVDVKVHRDLPDPTKDLVIRTGLQALATSLDNPFQDPRGKGKGATGGRLFYFLWSLERVAVAFDLKTLGGRDWYAWGAAILLDCQQNDGSWRGHYPQGDADTCFALLFLRRANLARDLTAVLKGKVQDVTAVELRGGGVGGEALKNLGKKLPISDDDDPKPPEPARTVEGPDVEADAARLAADLVRANGDKQALARLQESKGSAYTRALANAIPKLNGDAKTKARDALADRLARMSAATLKGQLQDDDGEVRRAAALATAMKDERTLIPRLIDLLDDADAGVVKAAHAALRSLAGADHGSGSAAWKAWWEKQRK